MFLKLPAKGRKFFLYHIFCVVLFAILYFLQDYFISNYSEIAKKLKFIPQDYDGSKDKANNIIYYIWFSLITQTTVGYGGLLNERTGNPLPWVQIKYRTYKVLNILQLISIFFISALLY